MIAIVCGDSLQDVAERRQAIARLLREVGAAEERPLVIVREEHSERPAAAALREHLLRDLVDAVDVGALLAIDFDVDEVLVEDPRRSFVFEALFLKYSAPMASVITDAQMNRLLLRTRQSKGSAAPGMPSHGVVRVLPEIRA